MNAAIANVKADDSATGKRSDFEAMASYLLPYDPVMKKRLSSGKGDNNVSEITGEVSSTFGSKPGVGETGVHLRYHKREEYRALTDEQKKELKEWRLKTNPEKSTKKQKGNTAKGNQSKDKKRKMVSAVEKAVKKIMKKKSKEYDSDDIDAVIMSLQSKPHGNENDVKQPKTTRSEEKPTTNVSTAALRTIIRRAKNNTTKHAEE